MMLRCCLHLGFKAMRNVAQISAWNRGGLERLVLVIHGWQEGRTWKAFSMFHKTCRVDLKLNNQTQHFRSIARHFSGNGMLHILKWVLIFQTLRPAALSGVAREVQSLIHSNQFKTPSEYVQNVKCNDDTNFIQIPIGWLRIDYACHTNISWILCILYTYPHINNQHIPPTPAPMSTMRKGLWLGFIAWKASPQPRPNQ